jgi:tetratricopeptide (TPR) repeat protein
MGKIFSSLVLLFSLIYAGPVLASNSISDSISSLLNEINNPVEVAKLELEFAWATKYEDLDKSIEITQNALHILEEKKAFEGVAIGYSYLGVYFYLTDELASSIQYLKKSELYFTENKDEDRLVRIYNNLGVAYGALYDNNKALEYYNKCLDIKKRNVSSTDISSNLINISSIYYNQGEYLKCIEVNEQALIIALQKNDFEILGAIYSNLGAAHERIGNYQVSINYALKALDIYQNNVDNKVAETRAYSNLGATYMSQKMFDEARYYFTLALDLNLNSESQKAVSLNNMAELERISKNLNLARKHALSALEIVNKLSNHEEKLISLNELYMIEEDNQKFELALNYYIQYITLSDSIMEVSNSRNTQIALAQNQLTLNIIQEEKATQRENIKDKKVEIMIWFFWMLIAMIITWIVLFFSPLMPSKIYLLILNFIISILFIGVVIMYLFLQTDIISQNGQGVLFVITILVLLSGTAIHTVIDSKVNNKYLND